MNFETPLERGTLIRRYKRFLSDVILEDGTEVTAHVANPGAMTGLAEAGQGVWLEKSNDPKRKLPWSWRLTEVGKTGLACVDTGAANKFLWPALQAGQVPDLTMIRQWQREVRYGENSRIDFLGQCADGPALYLEVKSVTLSRKAGLAEFPDTKTARGAKHMAELAATRAMGHRAMVLFLVQRTDCTAMRIATDIDPGYAAAAQAAIDAGVEVMCLRSDITTGGLRVGEMVPFLGTGT